MQNNPIKGRSMTKSVDTFLKTVSGIKNWQKASGQKINDDENDTDVSTTKTQSGAVIVLFVKSGI